MVAFYQDAIYFLCIQRVAILSLDDYVWMPVLGRIAPLNYFIGYATKLISLPA